MFLIKDNKARIVPAEDGSKLVKNLEAGVYNLNIHHIDGFFGVQTEIDFSKTDVFKGGKIIKSGIFKEVWNAIESFDSEEAKEARNILGIMHKAGFIFNGQPGTGKTFLAGQIAEYFAKKNNAIAFIVHAWDAIDLHTFIDQIREFDKDRQVIIILDEFEKHNGKKAFEDAGFLSFLDGGNSRNNTIILATTNSTGRLPDVLTDRPGRFEEIFKFDIKTDEILKEVIIGMLNGEMQSNDQIERLLKAVKSKSTNPSIDRIKVIVRDEIIKILKERKNKKE